MAVFFGSPIDITPGTTGSWTDIDLSVDVPMGATGVLLLCVNAEGANNVIGLRKNGSTDNRTQFGGFSNHHGGAIGIDANRIFEAFIADAATQIIWLVGYTTDDAVFFTNAIDKSTGTSGAWVDTDISADTGGDTAIAAYLEMIATGTGDGWGLRKNGSTDNRVAAANDPRHTWAVIGVDESEIFEQQVEGPSLDIFLVGYQMSGASFDTNAPDRSLSTTGSYVDLTALPAGSMGGVYEVWKAGANQRTAALRAKGDSADPNYTLRVGSHVWRWSACDASQLVQGKISNADVDFFEIGSYAAASPGAPAAKTLMLLGVGS
jgi:hypothetical protein